LEEIFGGAMCKVNSGEHVGSTAYATCVKKSVRNAMEISAAERVL
jgi:hypothetical protein